MNEYLKFSKLKQKHFKVKLRRIGNSFSATIPNEIIEFKGVKKEGTSFSLLFSLK